MELNRLMPFLGGALIAPLVAFGISASTDKFTLPEPLSGSDPYLSLLCFEGDSTPRPWFSKDEGRTFTLRDQEWRATTYTWVGANLDHHNITSDKGEEFHYQDHRNGGGFTLTSLNETKVIKCDPA